MYVRDLKSGKISLIRGPRTYLLGENERFWEKKLEKEVDDLINSSMVTGSGFIPLQVDVSG